GPDGRPQTLAAARAVTDPDNIDAEFGIIVRSDLKGQGLGRLMMDKLIRTLRAQGTQRLVATVLNDNKRMLALQRDLGFVAVADPDADGTRAIALDLQRTGAAG
ncbi:MAG: GNAT family N-acetyltransferase, partial [Rhodoferax sp.]|nr:GNAT family N-acetyltransferase [Rhodoferax sp.]